MPLKHKNPLKNKINKLILVSFGGDIKQCDARTQNLINNN